MARILYGVAGEGFGHSTRALEIINFLKRQGHQLKVASYDRGYINLRENFPVTKISGLRFVYRDNEVKYAETAWKNLLQAPEALKSFSILDKLIDEFKPQLIISDFEPLTAAIAQLQKIPLLSVDNEHVLTKTTYDYPKNYQRERQLARLVTRLMMFRAKAYVVLSFFACRPLNDKVAVLPPVIRQAVIALQSTRQDYVLVYLNNEFSGLLKILQQQDRRFIVYGFDCQRTDKNLLFKKFNQQEFLTDLAGAEAIIGTAGFSLISEALYLGKPYLAIPAGQQFEQILNAYHLAKLGYGEYHEQFSEATVKNFLLNMESYRRRLAGGIPSGNAAVFSRLNELIKLYAR